MDGATFLHTLAAEILEEGDLEFWWERYSSAYQALDLVRAVDVEDARRIGEDIRTGLAERTGEEIHSFHLMSRHPIEESAWSTPPARRPIPTGPLQARAAWAPLPAAVGSGGVNFVSWTPEGAWLVSSGAGPAPWRARRDDGSPALFRSIVDNRGRPYETGPATSAESSSGHKRHRWDLRSHLRPVPSEDVKWMRFETDEALITAWLTPPSGVAHSIQAIDPPSDPVEFYLRQQLHDHVWRHLLDPDSPDAPLTVVADALVAVEALDAESPTVIAARTVDAAIRGDAAPALPAVLASSLESGSRGRPWVGSAAVGVEVSPGGGSIALEAIVGHRDRFALHFLQPADQDLNAFGLLVSAVDSNGRGHVAHGELLSSFDQGAYHFRPPLQDDVTSLTVRLESPAWAAEVDFDIAAGNAGA